MLDAGCWILDNVYRIVTSSIKYRVSSIYISLLSLILISGCTSGSQPIATQHAVSAFPLMLSKSAPRLVGVNHLFTIEDHFSKPMGISLDAEGNLYVADFGKSAVHVLDSDGRLLESIGRFGWRAGEFDSPSDVAVDTQLRLYIADSGNNRVQKSSLISRRFSTIIGEKLDEPERSVTLREPQSIAIDTRGYVYIADTWNHRILKIDPLGRIQMEIGGIAGWAGQQFRNPQGVIVDRKGNIYISDTGNHRVHKLDFSGSQLAIWGEEGARRGQFRSPAGQAIDRFGNVYIADQGNHRIQVFSPEGNCLAEFGQQVLDNPFDVAVSNSLRAYVTDVAGGDIEVFRIIYEMAGDVENFRF